MKAFTTKLQGFTTTSEEQHESRLSCFPSAGGAKARRAFTLIETMVAITILSFAMAGPLFTASRAIIAAETARDQLTASYLAHEGVEYLRVTRDNWYLASYHSGSGDISGTAWVDFLASFAQCNAALDKVCTLDPVSTPALQTCSAESCTPLHLVDGMYKQQEGGVQTPFTRTIQIVDVSPTEEKVVSKVSWSFHGTPYTVTVSDHLTAWK